ncbi:MAG: hypothetical protein ACXAD7_28075 [Candidatus Kariarchaeaceae archaeon]|jgi:hypothetical protein
MSKSVFTDHIEDTGVVHRIYFYVGIGTPGNRDWYYFGVDSVANPPPEATYNSITEYSYVQFPTDFDSLDGEHYSELYMLALNAGLNKEGIT